jgi:hypothetical protein
MQLVEDDLIDYKNSITIKRSGTEYNEERWFIFGGVFTNAVWATNNWGTANKK